MQRKCVLINLQCSLAFKPWIMITTALAYMFKTKHDTDQWAQGIITNKAIASRVQVYRASPFNSPSFLTLSPSPRSYRTPHCVMWHVFLIIVMKSKMLSATGANSQTPKVAASCYALSVIQCGQVIFSCKWTFFVLKPGLQSALRRSLQSKSKELYSPAAAHSHRLNTWFSGVPWIAISATHNSDWKPQKINLCIK